MWLYWITVFLLENGLVLYTEGKTNEEVIQSRYIEPQHFIQSREENTVEKRAYQCLPLGQCVFPFTYKGIIYDTCTTADRGHLFWCSKDSVHVEGVSEWSKCTSCKSSRMTSPGAITFKSSGCIAAPECVFPFNHTNSQGNTETHGSCILDDDSQYWCEDENGLKHYCSCLFCVPPQSCVFPFTYLGLTYSGCTQANDDRLWCSNTPDYYTNQYSYCERCNLCDAPPECVFPFTYGGKTYYECTPDYHNRYWCAHNQDYNGGYDWSHCLNCAIEDNYLTSSKCAAPSSCVFPFTYAGVTYHECTELQIDTAYDNDDFHFWCSLHADYIGSRLPCDCDFCNRPSSCTFPFMADGVVHTKCARAANYFWCSHDSNYNYFSSYYSVCDCEI